MNTRFSQTVAVLTLFILLFLGGYWFLLIPQFQAMNTALKQLNISSEAATPKGVNKEQRAQQIAVLKNQAELLLPTEDKQYDLSVQMEAAAKNSGVTISSMVINTVDSSVPKTTSVAPEEDLSTGKKAPTSTLPTAAPAPPVTLSKLTVTMTVSGSYQAVQQWVQRVTSLERFIQIDQLGITAAASTGPTANLVTGQMTAFAYYLPSTDTASTP